MSLSCQISPVVIQKPPVAVAGDFINAIYTCHLQFTLVISSEARNLKSETGLHATISDSSLRSE